MTWLTQLISSMVKPFKWWVVIAPWERGVRVRLGKTATELIPGPHLRIPFLDRIYVQSIRLRTILETNQTISTQDAKVLTLSFAVRFAVADVVKLYQSVFNPEITLAAIVQSEVAAYIAGISSEELTVSKLEQHVDSQLPNLADWGLANLRFTITSFAYVRTYRIMNTDYRTGAGLYDLENDPGER